MATSSKIKVMISSRCRDALPTSKRQTTFLSDVRKTLKKEIESETVLGHAVYEVWINEDAVEDASEKSWDRCIKQAKDCDIFIVIFNGAAGWLGEKEKGTIGICHAEFQKAFSESPGKVFIVNISDPNVADSNKKSEDRLFHTYLQETGAFQSRCAANDLALRKMVKEMVVKATINLVQRGVRDASRGKHHLGPALQWSRLSFADRAAAMQKSAQDSLGDRVDSKIKNRFLVRRTISNEDVLFSIGAIPDSLSVPAARELVGQPHLFDQDICESLNMMHGGPIHVITCQKGVTESQATKMLGFPNATVIAAPFGVYVVDPVQSVQLVFIAQCRDSSGTRLGIQRFLEWLEESRQATELVTHAAKRKLVVKALAGK